jgi:hypothetical protein
VQLAGGRGGIIPLDASAGVTNAAGIAPAPLQATTTGHFATGSPG